jgi:hypothetical protein
LLQQPSIFLALGAVMRIRFWLYLVFGIFSILPLLSIGLWVQKSSIENEISSAGKSQLVLAETHADTMDRYIIGNMHAFNQHFAEIVRSNFGAIALDIQSNGDLPEKHCRPTNLVMQEPQEIPAPNLWMQRHYQN